MGTGTLLSARACVCAHARAGVRGCAWVRGCVRARMLPSVLCTIHKPCQRPCDVAHLGLHRDQLLV
jgi:hypothetical protein